MGETWRRGRVICHHERKRLIGVVAGQCLDFVHLLITSRCKHGVAALRLASSTFLHVLRSFSDSSVVARSLALQLNFKLNMR